MEPTGTIFRIKRYALHDGPGIRTTVFLKGCPLACAWCHNPEGIDPEPQTMRRETVCGPVDETVGRCIGVDELVREIEKDGLFFDESGGGVTLSGGEPLCQPDFVAALLGELARRDIHVALDTSGFAPAAVVERLVPLVRLVLFDLKIIDPEGHRRHTGVSNGLILDNLGRITRSGVPVHLRVPLIPGLTDGAANLAAIAETARRVNTIRQVDLLPFHRIADGKHRRLGRPAAMPGVMPPDPQRVARAKRFFESQGFFVTIGG